MAHVSRIGEESSPGVAAPWRQVGLMEPQGAAGSLPSAPETGAPFGQAGPSLPLAHGFAIRLHSFRKFLAVAVELLLRIWYLERVIFYW